MSSIVRFETINGMLDALLEKFSGSARPILMWKSEKKYRSLSYSDFGEWVDRIAFGLASIGVRCGDRVALLSENRPEWVVADMAMVRLGAVNVSIYPSLTPRQVEYILHDAGVSCVIISNRLQLNKILKIRSALPLLRHIVMFADPGADGPEIISFEALARMGDGQRENDPGYVARESRLVTPGHLLTLIYTSGTTGNPKGVMLTHANLVSNILCSTECIPFIENDLLLSYLPLCHSYERMAGYYSAMSCGATIAYAESIDTVRENLAEVRPTIVTTVPRLFERIHAGLMKQEKSLPPLRRGIFRWAMSVRDRGARRRRGLMYAIADRLVFSKIRSRMGGRIRFFVSGGAALSKDLGDFFDGIGISILEGYGMTETSPVITVNRPDKRRFGTVGHPIPDVEVKIASDGEILARGPNVMRGYWNDDAATGEIIDTDGWLHTGDIGKFDSEGFLVITDRKKHLIVSSGGKNIAPGPLENAFLSSVLINQILVIGDGRGFLSALVVPEFDQLIEHPALAVPGAHDSGPPGPSGREDLVTSESVRRIYQREIDTLQKDVASFERVRKFTLLPKPFTLEDGEVTPTLKIRRAVVEKKYRELIDRMYEGLV